MSSSRQEATPSSDSETTKALINKTPKSRRARTGGVGKSPRIDWAALFRSSRDYFAFVQRAAPAALRGDGTAALYVAEAVRPCENVVILVGGSTDPEEALQNWLTSHPYYPESDVAKLQHNFRLCNGFLHGNAFSMLPPRRSGYISYSYWLNIAYEDHNPVAEVFHVASELPPIGSTEGAQSDPGLAQAQKLLVTAVSSGDPEAIFRAGNVLLGGTRTNRIRAFAIALAGCDLGYDCSADNPSNDFIFGGCAQTGNCPPGEDFANFAAKSIGSSGYAKAYALAQQLEYAISQGDTATVARFVQLGQ